MKKLILIVMIALSIPTMAADWVGGLDVTNPKPPWPTQKFDSCLEIPEQHRSACALAAGEFNRVFREIVVSGVNRLPNAWHSVAIPQKLETGHTCSELVWLTDGFVDFNVENRINIETNLGSELRPIGVKFNTRVGLDSRFNMYTELGRSELGGGCSVWKSDDWWFTQNAGVDSKIGLYLQPNLTFRESQDGMITFGFTPYVHVDMDVLDLQFDLDDHGVDFAISAFHSIRNFFTTTKYLRHFVIAAVNGDDPNWMEFIERENVIPILDLAENWNLIELYLKNNPEHETANEYADNFARLLETAINQKMKEDMGPLSKNRGSTARFSVSYRPASK